jgi:hypothetical protein
MHTECNHPLLPLPPLSKCRPSHQYLLFLFTPWEEKFEIFYYHLGPERKNTDEDILVLEEVLHPNICNSRQNLKTRQFSNFPPKFVNTVHAAFYLPPFSQGAGDWRELGPSSHPGGGGQMDVSHPSSFCFPQLMLNYLI